jgi:hypothetical protein
VGSKESAVRSRESAELMGDPRENKVPEWAWLAASQPSLVVGGAGRQPNSGAWGLSWEYAGLSLSLSLSCLVPHSPHLYTRAPYPSQAGRPPSTARGGTPLDPMANGR